MEADYEKLERRSRIRTARARQINPQVNQMIRNTGRANYNFEEKVQKGSRFKQYEILGGAITFVNKHLLKGGCRLESGASDRFPGPSSLPTIGEPRI